MEAVVGEGNAVYVMLGLLVGKMIISATYALVMMVANLAIMISEIGATTLGIGLAIAIPAALGVMAVVGTMIAGAMAMVGDAVVPADGRPMVKPAGSPNTLVGRKDDDILMAPGIAKAGGTTQGGHGTTDVGAQFARGVKELKDEVKKMREDNKSYFGFGGTVAPGVGKSVVGGINDSVRYG